MSTSGTYDQIVQKVTSGIQELIRHRNQDTARRNDMEKKMQELEELNKAQEEELKSMHRRNELLQKELDDLKRVRTI